jgi:hypothetical protein
MYTGRKRELQIKGVQQTNVLASFRGVLYTVIKGGGAANKEEQQIKKSSG